jgi:hypothetical protein
MIDKAAVNQKVYLSAVLKNLKDFLTASLASLSKPTYSVRVENQETKLYKEIAENTRGVKGKLIAINDTIGGKTIDLKPIEGKLDKLIAKETSFTTGDTNVNVDKVTVTNLKDIQIPEVVIPKEVRISNLSDIVIPKPEKQQLIDISPLEEAVKGVKQALKSINDYLPRLEPLAFPKIEIPKQVSIKEAQEIISGYEKGAKMLSDDLLALSKVIKEQETGGVATEVRVSNFPPQAIPTPVTNININALKGLPKSSSVSISTKATRLPETALEQRRSLIIFNNSGATIYIGGADVTTSNGLPVLNQSYSPPIDAGQYMAVYGISVAGNAEVRVFEVSNDSEGN